MRIFITHIKPKQINTRINNNTMSNNKQSIKLYTEDQVREVVRLSLEDAETSVIWSKEWYPQKLADKILQSLQPIEIPSDEEIKNKAMDYLVSDDYFGFIYGAKWMHDKIKGGNNE